MIYLVQNSGIADTFTTKIITVLNELKLPWIGYGCTPDGLQLVGLEEVELSKKNILFGSTRAVQLTEQHGLYNPGVFYKNIWFEPTFPINKASNLLNSDIKTITIGEFKKNWINEPVFIKSTKPKLLTGQVIEVEEQLTWIEEHKHIQEEEELNISPLHTIDKEWRFFIVNGRIITGSLYIWNRIRMSNEPIPNNVVRVAQQYADSWLPNPTIVMDVCQLRDGSFRIVEYNSINSSGVYNSNVKQLIMALEENYG